jgi:hypothetical protein
MLEITKDMQSCLFLTQISAFLDTGHLSVCLRETGTGRNRPLAADKFADFLSA